METGKKLLLSGGKGFLIGGGLLLACRLLSGKGVGSGDVKLFAVLGLWFGSRKIVMIVCLTFILAACGSVPLLIFRKTDLKQGLPLAPFVLAGVIGVMGWT